MPGNPMHSDNPVRPGEQHPPEWRADLNPDPFAGQNTGVANLEAPRDVRTAYDVKDAHRQLAGFHDDELKQIPILPPGTRLQQGATYVDLNDLTAGEITARGDMEAGRGNWYVPKDQVPYQLWNRLIGVRNPERLGQADET